MTYIKTLIDNCNKAMVAKPKREFTLSISLEGHDKVEDLSELNGITKAIYIIREVDGDKQKTFNGLSEYKKRKETACPKLNSPSSVMYVGSSTVGVKSRIKQHLGNGSKQTSALHLRHWFKGKITIEIKVYDDSPEVLQIIEDALSHDLAPAFGKQGGNGR